MRTPRTIFPVAEGVGIFVGIVAWDLLSDGQMGQIQTTIIKAALIATPCSLVWFGVRWWRERKQNKVQK